MSDHPDKQRFQELLGLMLDESASDEQLNELTDLVEANADFSRELRLQLLMASELEQADNPLRAANVFTEAVDMTLAAEDGSEPFVQQVLARADQEQQPRSTALLFIVLSVAAAVVIVAGILHVRPAPPRPVAAALPQAKALVEVIAVDDAVGVDGAIWSTGQRFDDGRLVLASGTVELETSLGVRLVLDAPAELLLDPANPLAGVLEYGAVYAAVPPQAIGFTITTAEAEVVDLGTEFGVRYDKTAGTSVQVYDGEVMAGKRSDAVRKRLFGGEGILIGRDADAAPAELPFFPERFIQYLPDPDDANNPLSAKRRHDKPYNVATHRSISVVPAPQDPLVIDGSLDDWDLGQMIESRCEPPFDEFYFLKTAMAYDAQFLYVAAIVGDPRGMRNQRPPDHPLGDRFGGGGSIVVRMSTDREDPWPVTAKAQELSYGVKRELTPADVSDKLVFAVMWYYAPEQLSCLDLRYGMDRHGVKTNPPGYRGAYRMHADTLGYTVEYAIPWSLLGAADNPPQAGDVLACTWIAHWSGPQGKVWHGQLVDVTNPEVDEWNFMDAATWGKMVFK